MNVTPKCILQIKHIYPELTGKYKNIADYILENPGKIVQYKVKEIAKNCNCDNALIVRFCQKIGYSGFSDFKMSIASEFLPIKIDITDKEFSQGDSFAKLKQNFLRNNVKVLNDSVSLLREEDIKQAVEMLSNANKIYLLAMGASGIVAADTQIKLMRLGFNSVFNQDVEFSKILLGLCNNNDAVLAISFSGETENVCEMVAAVKEKDVPIISVTNYPNSKLARLSDINLLTASDEKVFRLGAMTSRIAQCLIIDFLIINMSLGNMERTEENIFRTYKMINSKKRKL